MASPVKILVTGANGQLAQELRVCAANTKDVEMIFVTKEELPVDDAQKVEAFIRDKQPHYLFNCAAYTAVDKAETDQETAYAVNADAAGHMAASCRKYGTRFLHISTDYVFDGLAKQPYRVDDKTGPQGVYGASKLKGEQLAMEANPDCIIIRTSWVYSRFGKNFVKTMIRLMSERESINVVSDQQGSPTYAADLADAMGLSTVHINRTLQELRGSGLIVLKGRHLTIPNLPALQCASLFNPNYLHLDHAGRHLDAGATAEA